MIAWVIGAMICDSLSGFYPNSIIRTGAIESLDTFGDGEWLKQTSFFVRLENESTIFVRTPSGIFYCIGEKVVVSERTTRLFHTKHYTLIRLLNKKEDWSLEKAYSAFLIV